MPFSSKCVRKKLLTQSRGNDGLLGGSSAFENNKINVCGFNITLILLNMKLKFKKKMIRLQWTSLYTLRSCESVEHRLAYQTTLRSAKP